MKNKNIEYFREVLTDQLEKILNDSENTVLYMTAPKEDLLDFTDCVFFETDRDLIPRTNERKTKFIKKIKEALDRIENDTYAICKTCGENISLAHLIVRPVSTQCIDCKTTKEATERGH